MGVGSGLNSLSALSSTTPCMRSTLCTLCTTAPFPVVLWQYTQLCLPCSPSGDLRRARVLGLLFMFQTVLGFCRLPSSGVVIYVHQEWNTLQHSQFYCHPVYVKKKPLTKNQGLLGGGGPCPQPPSPP